MTVGGTAGMLRSTYDARAGSRRGSMATTTWSAAISPAVVLTATGRASEAVPDMTTSRAVTPVRTSTRRSPRRLVSRRGEGAQAARHRPGAEVLLEVVQDAEPRRHVAGVVAALDGVVGGEGPQPGVLEAPLDGLVEHEPAGQQLLGRLRQPLDAGGPLEPVAAQQVPRLGLVVDVVDPLAARGVPAALARLDRPALLVLGGAEGLVDRGELGGAAAGGQPQHGAVGEAVLAHRVDRHQLELALQRAAGLAEEVAQHGRERGGGRAGVPGVAVLLEQPERPAQRGAGLDQRDVVAQLGQACRRGAAGQPAPEDHHA